MIPTSTSLAMQQVAHRRSPAGRPPSCGAPWAGPCVSAVVSKNSLKRSWFTLAMGLQGFFARPLGVGFRRLSLTSRDAVVPRTIASLLSLVLAGCLAGAATKCPVTRCRIDPTLYQDVTSDSAPVAVRVDSVPMVLLRVGDNSPNDAAFITRRQARGLYGELAVPTSTVGQDGRPNWDELRLHALQGFTIVA